MPTTSFLYPDAATRSRIASAVAAGGDCSVVEKMGRAIAAVDDDQIDGSEHGEVIYGKRASWYEEQARAALLAVREPSDTMLLAGYTSYDDGESLRDAFMGMIDAALAEKA